MIISLDRALEILGDRASWLDQSTYIRWSKKAKFIHPIHGEWITLPSTVAKGHGHPSDQLSRRLHTNLKKYGKKSKPIDFKKNNKNYRDLTGKVFSKLTVIEETHKTGEWSCMCECGNKVILKTAVLNNGHTRSCGCLRRETYKDKADKYAASFVDRSFGYWTVIGVGRSNYLEVRCVCGTIRLVYRNSLLDGVSTNCGCITPQFKTEALCRDILQRATKLAWPKRRIIKPFENVRYLELDGYCEELKLAFEYDGEQHYNELSFGKNSHSLEKRKIMDALKDEMCKQRNITLIRIPYTQKDNLEYFITNKLGQLKS